MSSAVMRNITLASLICLGLMPSVVLAKELPASVKAAATTLVNLGYTEVAVSLRVFGGYVLQGSLDGAFLVLALSPDGKTLVSTNLFRDLDGNGVFGQDESLGLNQTQPLATMLLTALADPSSVAGPSGQDVPHDDFAGDLNIPGFGQTSQNLLTGPILQVKAREQIGVGMPSSLETQTVTSIETGDEQRHGLQVTQINAASGLYVWDRDTVVSQPGGGSVTFSQPDVAAIRAGVVSAQPDVAALRTFIYTNIPTEDSIRAGIAALP